MNKLTAYLPQDRLRALARGENLPDRTTGATLFADISGFTTLTEALRHSLGSRQGAEALSKHLGIVYSALIAEVENYGGSVIGFAGDSITCWLDGQDASLRAVTCAYALQSVMVPFKEIALPGEKTTSLSLKVSVATGNARRLVVGNPDIHYIDALAGATVGRTSTAENLANKGEILVDEPTVNALGDAIAIKEWRNAESGEKFAVLGKMKWHADRHQPASIQQIEPDQLKAWIDKTVYERESMGQSSFLTEFRPCAVLFVNFARIDYDADDAQTQLDMFIRQMQRIVARYEGAVLQLTIGDKGSYTYINFGALTAHEDDMRRAVKTALALQNKTELQLQMGISQGVMRVGAYGGETRMTFGALGDDVNLAARLMTTASEGEILLSGHMHKAVREEFTFEPRAPLPMKGKAEPLPVFAVTGESQKRAVRLQEPDYALPMVGRVPELGIINEKLTMAMEGKSQVIGIVAEAGLGKSRLVAEVIRSARKKDFVGYGGACQSDSIHTPYQVWKSIWQAFFDVDLEQPLRKTIRNLEGEIEDRAPSRVDAMPLLNVVLDLNIPENEFTQTLEPKIRQSALHALLEDCLKAAAGDKPLLIVIEDLHWLDALSHDLLEQLAKALANYPVCFVLAYRPPQMARLEAPRLEALEQFTRVELHELTQAEAESAIRAKLAQLYPARGGSLPVGLVTTLMARAQGNPFYLEELLNYVRDRGLDPADIENIELPDSLHTLILSRIDQLSEAEKSTLRVASIVGRLFRAKWLTGYYPELGAFPQVKAALEALESLEITPLDSPEPELAYLFKHIVTHEVTYESLPFATRARLHEQLAVYLENEIDVGATHASPLLETLAFHYGRSDNTEKQIEYLLKAGEAAQKNFANDAALGYYDKLLPLLIDDKEKFEIHLKRGDVYQLLGKYEDAESNYLAALEFSKDSAALKAGAQFALGKLNRLRGEYKLALDWLAQAQEMHMVINDTTGLAMVLVESGLVLWRKGSYADAHEPLNKGLKLAREAGDTSGAAEALMNLGLLSWSVGNFAEAQTLFEASLGLHQDIGDKAGVASSLHCLGLALWSQGNFTMAQKTYQDSLNLKREMADKWGIANLLNNLGVMAGDQGDYVAAQSLNEECLNLFREMGDKYGIALALNNLGSVALAQGNYAAARALQEESLSLQREMDDQRGISNSLNYLGDVALMQGDVTTARALYDECLALCKKIDEKTSMAHALLGLGLAASPNLPEARESIVYSLRLRVEMGGQVSQISSLIGMAGLAMSDSNPTKAAQLLGGVESALKALKVVMEPTLKNLHTQTLAAVKAALGAAAFQSAWEAGAGWSLEEAVAYALEDSGHDG